MKRINVLFAVLLASLLLVGSAPVLAQGTCQLEMEFETRKKGKLVKDGSGTISFAVDQGKFGMTASMEAQPQVQLIIDGEAKTMTTVTTDDAGEQQAFTIPMLKLPNVGGKGYQGTVEATDETKVILGYEARKFILTDKDEVTETWIASIPGFSWAELAGSLSNQKSNPMMSDLPILEDYPNACALESTTTRKGGKEVTYSKTTIVAVGDAADLSVLEVPAGVAVQDMTSFMPSFGGGQ